VLCSGYGIDGLYYGFPVAEGYDTLQRSTCYRFHISDPVPFTKSLRVMIEHKGAHQFPDGHWDGYMERADDFSSVAYWYQIEPHKPFPAFPPAQERLYDSNAIVIEGESLIDSAKSSEDRPVRQDIGGCSGGAQLFFTPKNTPASVVVDFNVPRDGRYRLMVGCTKSWDYGKYQPYLDDTLAGKVIDLFNKSVIQTPVINLGVYDLKSGAHEMGFATTAKNTESKGYYLGLDFIELIPIGQ